MLNNVCSAIPDLFNGNFKQQKNSNAQVIIVPDTSFEIPIAYVVLICVLRLLRHLHHAQWKKEVI